MLHALNNKTMDAIKTIDALIENLKKGDTKYPHACALGALGAKFSSFIWYVEDLLDAVNKGDQAGIKTNAILVRAFLERIEIDSRPSA